MPGENAEVAALDAAAEIAHAATSPVSDTERGGGAEDAAAAGAPMSAANAPSTRQAHTDLAAMAEKAQRTGDRRALLAYLRARGGA